MNDGGFLVAMVYHSRCCCARQQRNGQEAQILESGNFVSKVRDVGNIQHQSFS